MHTSQSHDSIWSHFFPIHTKEQSSKQSSLKKFISFDAQDHLSSTDNKALGKSLRDIYRFVKEHPECTEEEVNLVTLYTNDFDKEQRSRNIVFRKVHSIDSFFMNLGETDETLIRKIEHKCLTHEFNHFMQNEELMKLIDGIVTLKKELKKMEAKRQSPGRLCLLRELSNEIENQNHGLLTLQQALRKKEFRKQINALLKKIKVYESDSPLIQEEKRKIALKHQELIEVVTFSQVQFNPEYQMKIIFEESLESILHDEYVNFSDKKTHNRKKSIHVETSTDLSESEVLSYSLIKNLRHIETCHLRDNELSVSKAFRLFQKDNNALLKKIYYKNIVKEFTQQIDQNALKDKLIGLITLQANIREERDRRIVLANLNHADEHIRIAEIKKLKKDFESKMNELKTEEYQVQIRNALKSIEVFEEDSRPIKEAKNQCRQENLPIITILEDIHRKISFQDEVEIKIYDQNGEVSEQKLKTLKFSTNFSDRFQTTRGQGYYSRSPSDFSVQRLIEKFLESSVEEFVLKPSIPRKDFDQTLLLNPRKTSRIKKQVVH